MNRRTFLRSTCLAVAAAGLGVCPLGTARAQDQAPDGAAPPGAGLSIEDERFVRPAMFYDRLEGGIVRCRLCPRQCEVAPGGRGACGVRMNRQGEYMTLVYGRVTALNNDPIEKKPFYHVVPGSMVLSLSTAGCNLSCKFCQNWQLSQFRPEKVEARYIEPQTLVALALKNDIPNLAFTYNEPTVFYEFMHETARLGHEAGLRCTVVSNGFTSLEAQRKLVPFLKAYKVDLKAFTDDFYRDYCHGRLKPVLETLENLVGLGVWVEIVNLVIPAANDREADVTAMARWIKTHLGPDVPIHFTRFRPMYKLQNVPPTPVADLERCCEAAKAEGLRYVYLGNVPGHPGGDTFCPRCGRLLIQRTGMWAVENHMDAGRCPRCRAAIPGVWS
ncbi:MAG: AmmeMemoRadiSam system radical SAM enzyme [Proteobacteria bacterium]|nr:AmmeMemoRadiSam system radical SAM enzyme [Pseudomonadota bacterium]